MAKTRLFVIRHGRTMFNTIGRAPVSYTHLYLKLPHNIGSY